MSKFIVNVPLLVEATSTPVSQADAATFGIFHEDVVQLSNVKVIGNPFVNGAGLVLLQDEPVTPSA